MARAFQPLSIAFQPLHIVRQRTSPARGAILAAALAGCAANPPSAAPSLPPAQHAAAPSPATTGDAAVPAAEPAAPAPVATSAPQPAPPVQPMELVLERAVTIGKWPEGVVVVGDTAWVAESGNRRVAAVDLKSGGITARIPVGRLPVQMAASPEGVVYALAHTDKTIWAIDPGKGRGQVIAQLPDYPDDMVFADGALWVLLWSKGSSAGSSVVRVDPATRRQSRSAELGPSAFGLAVGHGRVWVAHADGTLSVVDQATLGVQADVALGGSHQQVVSGAGAVFTDVENGVARIDPQTGKITHQAALGERISLLRPRGQELIAVGLSGRAWLLDPADLVVRAVMSGATTMREPHAIAQHGESLLITEFSTGDSKTEDGRLLILRPKR